MKHEEKNLAELEMVQLLCLIWLLEYLQGSNTQGSISKQVK
uniref:Uncharacterized protein n=1 Tax=Rhizophora mucronata TaxID=61149 RepID=A0A2P2N7X7_RHIMU